MTNRPAAGAPDERVSALYATARRRHGRSRGTKRRDADTATISTPTEPSRARELESEIAHTRAEMSETIEAIQEKLRPSNLVSDATERVKTATTEKVKSMADTASETAQDMMRGTRERAYDMVEGAKQNPIPALMIGAGVAWLLMDRSRNKNTATTAVTGPRSGRNDSPRSERSYSSGDDYYRSTEANYSDVDYSRQTGTQRYGYGYGRESGLDE